MPASTPPSEIFPKRLVLARNYRGLNQGDLAKKSGLQPTAISHFETSSRKPSFDNLRRLADALEVTTDYLLGRVDGFDEYAGADRLHRHYDLLSADDREVADQMLKMLAERAQQRRNKEE